MRLLTVTHFYEEHGGGIERVAGQLNRRFVTQGHATSWAAAAEGARPDAATATPVAMPCFNAIERLTGLPMPIPGLIALRRLARAVRESDAVVVHDALYLSSIAAMLLAKRRRKPVVLIQHIAGIPFVNPLLKRVMALANLIVTRPMLRAADQVVFISDTVRDAFATVVTKRPALLLFNGVDATIFRPAPAVRAEARAELGMTDARPLLLFVGRFVEKKGLAIIRRAAAARPDWQVVMAGHGPIDPVAWGLPNIRVLHDRSGASLASLYQAADMLILPSVGEGFPLVVQEAMACGLPVICGAETSRADPLARPWLSPVEVDLRDPDASSTRLVTAVDTLSMTDSDRAAMSAYAQATYDWSAMAARIVEAVYGATETIRQPADRAASSSAA
ncbi:glycosyltransferase family 4 protein [Sphingomonas sp. AR_OL41]|jgi:glycosyltransferase involved in cell wall biosynthesis|uniref:glycosyltransferase family 4 protein n=1 Tax=Sphingomonas sp. AR_OL41 TaxID=3042729 RepID=UPI00247FE35C|nr:glycosyltransferase family 4 protein [Sphingomonas sp. AR_OL41]MDH7974886.1 glycosyltransferase family 4 protein [Sphingomonas sp. AR_OL41]